MGHGQRLGRGEKIADLVATGRRSSPRRSTATSSGRHRDRRHRDEHDLEPPAQGGAGVVQRSPSGSHFGSRGETYIRKMVGRTGFEPVTSSVSGNFGDRKSTHL